MADYATNVALEELKQILSSHTEATPARHTVIMGAFTRLEDRIVSIETALHEKLDALMAFLTHGTMPGSEDAAHVYGSTTLADDEKRQDEVTPVPADLQPAPMTQAEIDHVAAIKAEDAPETPKPADAPSETGSNTTTLGTTTIGAV